MENQLVKIVTESGLEQTKAQVLLTNFQNYFEIAAEWETKIDSLNVTDVSQVAEMKMAKEKEDSLEIERKKQVDEFAKQKADADAKLKAANDEKKRLEDEVKAKNKAEQDAIDKEIADQKARLKAEKEAAKAPDRERLNLWVDSMVIKGIGTENLNEESVQIANEIMTKFSAFKNWAKTQVTNL